MRCTGNTSNWEFQVWQAGRYHSAPAVIDHAMIGMALETSGDVPRLAMLMHDRCADLVPPGDDRSSRCPSMACSSSHLAMMHAANLGLARRSWPVPAGPPSAVLRAGHDRPRTARRRRAVPILRVADQGWALLAERDGLVRTRQRGPSGSRHSWPVCSRETPQTFIAGDWKLGNLGTRPNGETVLLDWAYPGEAPPAWELAWYLALNRARIPESQGGRHCALPSGAGSRRRGHRALVGAAARPLPARRWRPRWAGRRRSATPTSWPGGPRGPKRRQVAGCSHEGCRLSADPRTAPDRRASGAAMSQRRRRRRRPGHRSLSQ